MKEFIKNYKKFENEILEYYNPSSKGLCPQEGIVRLYELYLKTKKYIK